MFTRPHYFQILAHMRDVWAVSDYPIKLKVEEALKYVMQTAAFAKHPDTCAEVLSHELSLDQADAICAVAGIRVLQALAKLRSGDAMNERKIEITPMRMTYGFVIRTILAATKWNEAELPIPSVLAKMTGKLPDLFPVPWTTKFATYALHHWDEVVPLPKKESDA